METDIHTPQIVITNCLLVGLPPESLSLTLFPPFCLLPSSHPSIFHSTYSYRFSLHLISLGSPFSPLPRTSPLSITSSLPSLFSSFPSPLLTLSTPCQPLRRNSLVNVIIGNGVSLSPSLPLQHHLPFPYYLFSLSVPLFTPLCHIQDKLH